MIGTERAICEACGEDSGYLCLVLKFPGDAT